VDVGNKNLGLKALQTYFDASPDEVSAGNKRD
jgi:hypothetical protein